MKMFFIGVAAGNSMGVVDVRDVAEAHVRAVDNKSAHGRYCLLVHLLPLNPSIFFKNYIRYLLSSKASLTDFELADVCHISFFIIFYLFLFIHIYIYISYFVAFSYIPNR